MSALAFFLSTGTIPAEKTLIYLEHSETLNFDEAVAPDCQILVGNVKFRHDSAYMYCDTAYFYNQSNLIHAMGNIRMEQGDTLFVYGDRLYYDGNTKLARLRDNVRMENKDATLYTDSLNYDRIKDVGYYFIWGKLVDSTNVLTSINGSYYPDHDLAVFQRDVVLTTPDGILYSDTLRYNTKSGMARIVGPSTIIHDSTTVYSEKGWYDTKRDYSQLLDNSVITDADGRTLTADTIFYDHKNGFAECRIAATLRDTAEKVHDKTGDFYRTFAKRQLVPDGRYLVLRVGRRDGCLGQLQRTGISSRFPIDLRLDVLHFQGQHNAALRDSRLLERKEADYRRFHLHVFQR